MVESNEYMIPIKGLKEGWHEFEFILNKNSIDIFDHEMDVKLKLGIDKKSTFYHFYFDFNGKIIVHDSYTDSLANFLRFKFSKV